MTTLWFESALLPTGCARSVRLTSSAGRIERVSVDTPPQPADERHAIAVPPSVRSHAFQRGLALAGLAGNFQSNARLLGSREGQMRTLRRRKAGRESCRWKSLMVT